MASSYDDAMLGEHGHGDHSHDYHAQDMPPHADSNWQNGGQIYRTRTPDNGSYRPRPPASAPGTPNPPGWAEDQPPRKSAERNRSRGRSGRSASGQTRTCQACGEPLTGQFVRALDGTFHLDCFKCQDCGEIVASKFFPAEDENGRGQYPLCETDYFRRLGLLCYQCGGALRGSYITALDRKYHVDHFTCSLCSTIFGAQDSYYEHDGNVYCHYHYSTQFAQQCNGCQTAILKQFVEIFRNGQNQHWHPECYMIHKFWNVRLAQPTDARPALESSDDAAGRDLIRVEEERMEEKVFRIWSVLSTFEESSAACISDMLLHVSNGSYVEGVFVAKRFIWHVEILFQSADRLDETMVGLNEKGMSYGREAKLLCKKIVSFFSLLSKTQDNATHKLGVTQELLSLVTGLAHYLKLLIRICLQGALRLEREASASTGLYQFLDDLSDLDAVKNDDGQLSVTASGGKLSANDSDHCSLCHRSVEDECAKNGDLRWHLNCVKCTRCGRDVGRSLQEACLNALDRKIYCTNCAGANALPLEHVSKLQQYVFLLRVALARLLDILKANGTFPRSKDDTDNNGYGTGDGQGSGPRSRGGDSQSRGLGGSKRESSYENTLNDVRRLRSTRLDRHLSSSARQARSSRVMDTDGKGPRPGSSGDAGQGHGAQGSTDIMFGQNDGITLDDISRIVAVEQSRDLQQKAPQPFQDRSLDPSSSDQGHLRTQSADRERTETVQERIGRRFFSELSGLEYFNVRHLAVLTMQPMIEQEFSLEELLSFIESRKQGVTFWKNIGKAFKNDKSKNVKKKGVFGVPLEIIIERDGAESTDGVGPGTLRIPAVIDDIVSSMRKMDLSVEGVFRKNGNIKKLQGLVDTINAEGCDVVNFMEQPVVQLAALLKRYLRDLPDPLMTHKLYRLWISAAKISDPEKRKRCLHLTCCLLPKSHRDCLEILFSFLKWAGTFHQLDEDLGSKMDTRNLATVIAPNILTNPNRAPALDSEAMYVIDAVEMMITHIEEMCQVPDEILGLMNDPYIFTNSGDLTTKDILKRFQDRRGQISIADVNEVYNRQDNSTRPPARRVETDPAVWQGEATVRTIQDPSMPNPSNGHGTPPARFRGRNDLGNASPYGVNQFNQSDSQLDSAEHSRRREWRNSGMGRQGSGLGVSGNS
ncbi:Rho-type GTPase-activating 1 [Fusarium agapanthi]|uniref:Rho-type GTPase-activating 1 n=1 Tax=Fusarium agapanthi TaxID=1803897 RepID=A0A9P5EG45_9HYPO|nr:Rho-type GTPase-activating 1 [Fusarium agapanthi]